MSASNLHLVEAFPSAVRADALIAVSVLPQGSLTANAFSVSVGHEILTIPYRIYHDPNLIRSGGLTTTQAGLLSCLMTRHHNGFVRERYLKTILELNDQWIPPFVVRLVGEYVVEIVDQIRDKLDQLDPGLYGPFLRQNLAFYELTKQRVASYWNCYYTFQQKPEYAGFQVLEAFDGFVS